MVFKVIFMVYDTKIIQFAPKGWSIADLKEGFWINDDMEITTGSDNRYWIPGSAIQFVEKMDECNEEDHDSSSTGRPEDEHSNTD